MPEEVTVPTDPDECFAMLLTEFGMDRPSAEDFLSCSYDQQLVLARGYRRSTWGQKDDRFALFMAIIGVVGTAAGIITGVAGAGSAVLALKAAL